MARPASVIDYRTAYQSLVSAGVEVPITSEVLLEAIAALPLKFRRGERCRVIGKLPIAEEMCQHLATDPMKEWTPSCEAQCATVREFALAYEYEKRRADNALEMCSPFSGKSDFDMFAD